MHEQLSINGEVTLDVTNADVPVTVNVSEMTLDMALSPLVHARAAGIELVFGPKAGFWVRSREITSGPYTDEATLYGWVVGLNAGIFFPVGVKALLGGVLSAASRQPLRACVRFYGEPERCASDGLNDITVLGFTLAALY